MDKEIAIINKLQAEKAGLWLNQFKNRQPVYGNYLLHYGWAFYNFPFIAFPCALWKMDNFFTAFYDH